MPRPPLRQRLRNVGLSLLSIVVVLALVEGFASLGLFGFDLLREGKGPVPERSHTRYDPELGWVNVPGTRADDLYGPGLAVTIDARGFRALPGAEPDGAIRVVCSGDSFTFGFGVGDADTWPAALSARDPRLVTVNMAQAGYGLDQIYLWYRRDGAALEHQGHVLAIVVDDVWRMRFATFLGYAKPHLELVDGKPVAAGVPVPKRSYLWPWLTQNGELVRSLRVAQLFSRFLPAADASQAVSDEETWRLALAVVTDLAERHRLEGRVFLFVFLPTARDYLPSPADAQRAAFLAELTRREVPALDLVPVFRRLPEARHAELFIRPGELAYGGAAFHYSPAGNRFVAAAIDAVLRTSPLGL